MTDIEVNVSEDGEISATVGAGVDWNEIGGKPDNIVSSDYPTGGSAGNVLKKTASGMEWAAETVSSVNGQTGTVVLDYEDVGAAASSHTHAQSDVTGLVAALAGKQDTISDLATIRSGAAAGATAVQPATLSDYQVKLGLEISNEKICINVSD